VCIAVARNRHGRRSLLALVSSALAASLLSSVAGDAPRAEASYAGRNGRIAFVWVQEHPDEFYPSAHISTVKPDGTGTLTSRPTGWSRATSTSSPTGLLAEDDSHWLSRTQISSAAFTLPAVPSAELERS
jgi:hypothetical protein